jgi:arylsulfatase
MVGGFRVVAQLELGDGAIGEGVLAALGDLNEGFSLYLYEGRATACCSVFGRLTRIRASSPLGPGSHLVELTYRRGEGFGGPLTLSVDGHDGATGSLPMPPFFAAISSAGVGLLVGRDRGLPFCEDYEPPFPFKGRLNELAIETLEPMATPEPGNDLATTLKSD